MCEKTVEWEIVGEIPSIRDANHHRAASEVVESEAVCIAKESAEHKLDDHLQNWIQNFSFRTINGFSNLIFSEEFWDHMSRHLDPDDDPKRSKFGQWVIPHIQMLAWCTAANGFRISRGRKWEFYQSFDFCIGTVGEKYTLPIFASTKCAILILDYPDAKAITFYPISGAAYTRAQVEFKVLEKIRIRFERWGTDRKLICWDRMLKSKSEAADSGFEALTDDQQWEEEDDADDDSFMADGVNPECEDCEQHHACSLCYIKWRGPDRCEDCFDRGWACLECNSAWEAEITRLS